MSKKNILTEALADSKALKQAAYANAHNMILEGFKSNLKEMVDEQINEMSGEEGGDEAPVDELDLSGLEGGDEGEDTMATEDEFNLSEADESAEDEGSAEDEAEDEAEGLSEADFSAALTAALQEVDHGGLGDMDEIDDGQHPTGLMDKDAKEAGWEEKTTPNKKDFTMKEGVYKKRIVQLVTENTMLKKANEQLKKVVSEVNLFNTKLHYAHRFLQKEGLDDRTKKTILEKFDKVTTVSEAKRLFESLEIAIGAISGSKPAGKKPAVKPLSEALGITQKNGGANLKESKQSDESNPFDVERMKVIAGITKK